VSDERTSVRSSVFVRPAAVGIRELDPETRAALDELVEAEAPDPVPPTQAVAPLAHTAAPPPAAPPAPAVPPAAPKLIEPLPAAPTATGHILPTSATEDGVPRGLRSARRVQRQRRERTLRLGIAAVITVVAIVVGLLVGLRPSHSHPAAVAAARTQQTLLVGIGAAGQAAQAVMLFGSDPHGQGASMLIPSGTVVDGPGATVGGSYDIAPAAEFSGAVSDLLGVTVDATWRLTPAGLAALVDQVGGVSVDVDQAINTTGLVLSPGQQQLAGPQAAAYATYLGGQTQQAELNRTRLVFDGILAKLPAQANLTPLIGSLAANSTSSWNPARLSAFLTALKTSNVTDNESILPVNPLDAGGDAQTYGIDASTAATSISAAFGPSLLRDHGAVGTRVQVVNDSGRPGLATSARAKLSAHQLSFVRAVNDKPFHQYTRSAVLVFDSSASTIAFGHRVAAALGLPNAPVLVSSQKTGVADALAVLADDYVG
jgi:hypothetical protein